MIDGKRKERKRPQEGDREKEIDRERKREIEREREGERNGETERERERYIQKSRWPPVVHAKQDCDTIALLGDGMSTSSNCVLAAITVSTISSMLTTPCLILIIFLRYLRTLPNKPLPAIDNVRVSSSVPPVPDTNKTPP